MDQTGSARSYPTSTTARCGKERKAQRPEKDRTKQQKNLKEKGRKGEKKKEKDPRKRETKPRKTSKERKAKAGRFCLSTKREAGPRPTPTPAS
eukprot:352422-Chlamydomonas_euryale.AAC.6